MMASTPTTTELFVLQCAPLGVPTRDFGIEMIPHATLEFVRGAILGVELWTVDLSHVSLYLAKEHGDPHGDWLSIHHEDYALLKSGDAETIARYLNRDTAIALGRPMLEYFSSPIPADCVHIFVKVTVTPEQSPLKKQKTMATRPATPNAVTDFWSNYRLERVEKVPLKEFNLDGLEAGTMVETPTLHAFWEGYGGFPASYLVRKEETQVWKIITEAFKTKHRVVLLGSPGVGKSTLLAQATFYVAFVLRKKVLVIRRVKDHRICNAVVYLTPDGEMYRARLVTKAAEFVEGQLEDTEVFVVGYSQQELQTLEGGALQTNTFLVTSCPYDLKSDDHARLVLLPAWKTDDLLLYAKQTEWAVGVGLGDTDTVDLTETSWSTLVRDHFFYSGGSLRDFGRTTLQIKNHVGAAWRTLRQDEAIDLVYQIFSLASATPPDRLCRQYVLGAKDQESYEDNGKWYGLVDSGYALRCLGPHANVSSLVELYKQAKTIGGGIERIAFEQLVHRFISAFTHKSLVWDLRQQPTGLLPLRLEACVTSVSCSGDTEAECMGVIKRLPWGAYWYPKYPGFPCIDAIMPCKMYDAGSEDGEDAVVYVQVATNVSEKKERNEEHFTDLETAIEENASLKGKKRVLLIVTHSALDADAFDMQKRPPEDKLVALVSYVDPNGAEER